MKQTTTTEQSEYTTQATIDRQRIYNGIVRTWNQILEMTSGWEARSVTSLQLNCYVWKTEKRFRHLLWI